MKLQINVSDELVQRIDFYAKKMGISRSALCATWIGQGVMTYDKSFEMLNDYKAAAIAALDSDLNAAEQVAKNDNI